jgi:hypothetical protein
LGNGGTKITAKMLNTMTRPMMVNQRADRPRPFLGCVVGSVTSGVRSWSLDTLAPHTGARLDAALGSSTTGR